MTLKMTKRNAGFTMIEIMVSITVLLLAVITAAGVMVVTEQAARASEERYQSFAEMRNDVEGIKAEVSETYPTGLAGGSGGTTATCTKTLSLAQTTCVTTTKKGVGSLSNLVRLDMEVPSSSGSAPIKIVTYFRAYD